MRGGWQENAMNQRNDLRIEPWEELVGDPRASDSDQTRFGFAKTPFDKARYRASPISRLSRIILLIAIFFCGWAVLRIGQINLTLSDVLLSLVLAVMLVRGEIDRSPFGNLTVLWLIGLGLMLSGLLVGTLANGGVERWLIVGAQYLFALMLLPMLLAGQQVSLTRILPALFVLGIAISQLIGISAMMLFENADTKDLLGDGFLTGNGRLGAMTGEPNPNGAMIAFALPMLLFSLRERIMPLGIGILCGALLMWGLLASGSFTGFVAALLALVVYFSVSGLVVLVRAAALGAVGLGLFLASGLPLPAAFENRVVGAVSTGNLDQAGTFTGRSLLIKEAWAMADDNILVGLGVDRFREVSIYGAPVHELHLLIWNEGGVIALAGLVTMLLTLVAAAFVARARSRPEGAMIFAVIVVFNVYTVSIPHMYSRVWILPVLLALATVFARRPTHSSPIDGTVPQR